MAQTVSWRNWARTVSASPSRIAQPRSVDELASIVAGADAEGLHVKAVGSGHSFTPIAATDGVLVSMSRLDSVLAIDIEAGSVTVEAGLRLDRLNDVLHENRLALPNLSSIDRQTVSGAISTGTHGTGVRRRGIADCVTSLELVLADGDVLTCSDESDPSVFAAARVGLGALGVIARVTLRCVPSFLLHAVETPMELDAALEDLDDLIDDNDHFELDWFPHTTSTLTKRCNGVPAGTTRERLSRASSWVDDELVSNKASALLNKLGSAHRAWVPSINRFSSAARPSREYIDDSYRVFVSHERVRFREMEWALPIERVRDVIREIRAWIEDADEMVSFPIGVRFAAADDIWMSTGFERTTGYVAVKQYAAVDHGPYFRAVQEIASANGGRPHWGKVHHLDASGMSACYPRFDDFIGVRHRLDPRRTFTNPHLDHILGP